MKRRVASFFLVVGILFNSVLAGIILLSSVSAGAASPQSEADFFKVKVQVDGKMIDFPDAKPFIDPVSWRTLVPVRFVSQALGAKVDWNDAKRTVTINNGGKIMTLKIGENKALVGNRTVTFEQPAIIKDSRTFVPLRFVSESYGILVRWLQPETTVLIDSKPLVFKDITGKQVPVSEKDPSFLAFHNSLQIKNGILTGTVPKSTGKNILIQCEIMSNFGPSKVVPAGQSFSVKVVDVWAFGFFKFDRTGKGKTLVDQAYRDLHTLKPINVKKAQ